VVFATYEVAGLLPGHHGPTEMAEAVLQVWHKADIKSTVSDITAQQTDGYVTVYWVTTPYRQKPDTSPVRLEAELRKKYPRATVSLKEVSDK